MHHPKLFGKSRQPKYYGTNFVSIHDRMNKLGFVTKLKRKGQQRNGNEKRIKAKDSHSFDCGNDSWDDSRTSMGG